MQTLTGNAQPLFGDKITAAFNKIKQQPNGFYFVAVAKASQYQLGDRIILGIGSGSPTNCLMVGGINTSTNILSCMSEGDAPVVAWPVNTQLCLDIACAQLIVQSGPDNAGTIWLGSDNTVTNIGGGSAFGYAPAGGSYNFGQAQWNCLRTSEAWMAGTLNDLAGVPAIII
jgi:hypothetical protein